MRALKLFFRTVLCTMLPLCLLCGGLSVSAYNGKSNQNRAEGSNLRVMTYNVLVDNDETLGGWSWGKALGNRGDKASACINYYKPDVIGFQECNYKWHVSLRKNLPDYDFVNPDVPAEQYLEKKESLGKKDWMCTTLMYNTKTLKLVKNELIGYSVNYWGSIQRMRYVSFALFEIRVTGERFSFISTHLDAEPDEKGQQMRLTQSDELAACINRYKATYGCPVISTGDYNSSYSDQPIQNVVKKAGMTSDSRNRGGIDYILFSEGIQSKYFTVVNDKDVADASDHKPVFADLAVTKHSFPTTKKTTTTTTKFTTDDAVDWEDEGADKAEEDTDVPVNEDGNEDDNAQDGSSDGNSTIVIQGEDEKGGGLATDLTPLLNVAKWIGIGLAGVVVLGVGITATVLMIKNRKKK